MTRDCRLLFVLPLLLLLDAALVAQTGAVRHPRLKGVILVKGATASASDQITPLPEGTLMTADSFQSRYFGISYRLPDGWTEKLNGPPPSDSGNYVLALLVPSDRLEKKDVKGSVLIQAQDLFFTRAPITNAMEMIAYVRRHLLPSQQVELEPSEVRIGGSTFARFGYGAPEVGLHWRIAATEIRCHAVQFVFTGPDPGVLDGMLDQLSRLELPRDADAIAGTGGGRVPLCVPGYAVPANIVERVEPDLGTHRFNPIPVRLIIDKKGRVKHVHMISAFPEQRIAFTEALLQWRFKPFLRNGKAVEIETGIMFGT